MKFLALILMLLPVSLLAQKPHYVHAPSGLNMRATSDPGSQKLMTVPFGAKLSAFEAPAKKDMTIDNLSGGMAKVTYDGTTGYMFSGYLSILPAPTKRLDTEKYVNQLRNGGISYLYSYCREDYDGVFSVEEAFRVPKDKWQDAFLVAQVLYELPKVFKFPGHQGSPGEKTYSNPDQSEYVWSEGMVVTRDIKGKLQQIAYHRGQEGGGVSIVIAVEGDGQDYLRVTYGANAD